MSECNCETKISDLEDQLKQTMSEEMVELTSRVTALEDHFNELNTKLLEMFNLLVASTSKLTAIAKLAESAQERQS